MDRLTGRPTRLVAENMIYHAIEKEQDRGKAVPTDTIRHNASIWNNDLTDAL